MSDINAEDHKEEKILNRSSKGKIEDDLLVDDSQHSDVNVENPMPCPRESDHVNEEKPMLSHRSDVNIENHMPYPEEEEEIIKKKYGGMLPKKPPLISKDHERAFFDSADWALGKQGSQKTKGPLEALTPKLQPSPHHQLRSRSAYAPMEGTEVDDENNNGFSYEDQRRKLDDSNNDSNSCGNQSCCCSK